MNREKIINGIITWPVSLIMYSAVFLDWAKEEEQDAAQKTGESIMMNKGLHPKRNTNILHISRKEEGRRRLSIGDSVDLAKLGLTNFLRNFCE